VQAFHCQRCGRRLGFTTARCPSCGSEQGFVLERRQLAVIEAVDGALYEAPYDAGGPRFWRCLNAAWDCNWLIPAERADSWCESCRLTRGRPDEANTSAVQAWSAAEAAKRVLIYQLHGLRLPIRARSLGEPDGLAFDLVYVPGATSVTGHRSGIVTIDLTEYDDQRREALRKGLGEPYRTLLGHLRHEIGHYYWTILIDAGGRIDAFRQWFGDERVDYAAVLERYYARKPSTPRDPAFISAYASSHPWEDWAETFAHYLHILDTLETAAAVGLHLPEPLRGGAADVIDALAASGPGGRATSNFAYVVEAWIPLVDALNAVSQSMGERPLYPFVLTPPVIAKLSFVNDCIRDSSQ
jgi:hypothetical protein